MVSPGDALSKVVLLVDWSEESSKALVNLLEARKLLHSIGPEIFPSEVEVIEAEVSGEPSWASPPALIVSGSVILSGRAPTIDELLDALLLGCVTSEAEKFDPLRSARSSASAGSASLLES
ncbi:MAG: hypothetical protein QXU97_06065 [Fervidicoccaceae archaeon]